MKAILWTAYGGPNALRLGQVPKPEPNATEVLVRVHASTVTAGDCEIRGLKLPLTLSLPMRAYVGILKPKRIRILGQEFAGTIEAVGKEVRQFRTGDRVFGLSGFRFGGYGEYLCRPENRKETDGVMAVMPDGLGFQEAAALPLGGLESLCYLRKAEIRPGDRVLIIGAGGSIGTIGVQLAKHYGAEITAVDHTQKLDMLRSLGADHVIDYTRGDVTHQGATYDVIFDVVGKTSIVRGMNLLRDRGTYLLANPRASKIVQGRWAAHNSGKTFVAGNVSYDGDDLEYLKSLIVQGALRVIVDRTYPLEQVADAHRYVETGMKAGSVVIDVLDEREME